MITVTSAASYQTELDNIKQKQKEEEKETSPPPYLDEPTDYDYNDMISVDQKELLQDSKSILSSSTLAPSRTINPTRKLRRNTRGIGVLRLPVRPSEMQILVSTAKGGLVYVSTRVKTFSGNAVLSSAAGKELGEEWVSLGPREETEVESLTR